MFPGGARHLQRRLAQLRVVGGIGEHLPGHANVAGIVRIPQKQDLQRQLANFALPGLRHVTGEYSAGMASRKAGKT